MILRESRPRGRAGVLKQRVSGTVVLLDLELGQYYALDEVGGRVWELCDGTRSVAEVCAILHQEYEAPAETIAADVRELLEDLARENLVVDTEAARRSAGAV